jgi:hypothetical protein
MSKLVARTSISMPDETFAEGKKRQKDLGYRNFSDYIESLIRADTMSKADHVRKPNPSNNPPAPDHPPTPRRKKK